MDRLQSQEPVAAALLRSRREPDAFELVYRRHATGLVAFVARRVYDLDTATDLAAESFARAYLKRASFRGDTDAQAAAWLYAVARREILQFFRRKRIELRALNKLGLEPPQLTDSDQERVLELAGLDELRATVRAELEQLSQLNRDALRLRVVDQLPYDRVAKQLGISQATARARVARGMKALTAALDGYDDDSPLKEGLT